MIETNKDEDEEFYIVNQKEFIEKLIDSSSEIDEEILIKMAEDSFVEDILADLYSDEETEINEKKEEEKKKEELESFLLEESEKKEIESFLLEESEKEESVIKKSERFLIKDLQIKTFAKQEWQLKLKEVNPYLLLAIKMKNYDVSNVDQNDNIIMNYISYRSRSVKTLKNYMYAAISFQKYIQMKGFHSDSVKKCIRSFITELGNELKTGIRTYFAGCIMFLKVI
jgi:hypothetical protein